MREINLPISQTFSLTVDPNKLDFENAEEVDGVKQVYLGNIVNAKKNEEIETARLNGGKVLYATTSIEKLIERLLVLYFIGPFQGHDERRVLFENELIQSSSMSFKFKKELVKKVIDQHDLMKGKAKNKLQGYLKDIMTWRNAFAHGHIKFNDPKGCVVEYYSSGLQELYLTDEFWAKLEKSFEECEKLLKTIDSSIASLYSEESNKT